MGFLSSLSVNTMQYGIFNIKSAAELEQDLDRIIEQSLTLQQCEYGFLPCLPYIGNCYGKNKVCMYDLTHSNRSAVCFSGAHLLHCIGFNCGMQYKGYSSYCIPWRIVCDRTTGCLYLDDEVHCSNFTCPGMLMCSTS